jgi:hypothetical protein
MLKDLLFPIFLEMKSHRAHEFVDALNLHSYILTARVILLRSWSQQSVKSAAPSTLPTPPKTTTLNPERESKELVLLTGNLNGEPRYRQPMRDDEARNL